MSDELERMIADKLADGKITDGDAEEVRNMADFLSIVGKPKDGNVFGKLAAADRYDLIYWAIGNGASPVPEEIWWDSLDDEQAHLNTAGGSPGYDVEDVCAEIVGRSFDDPSRVLDLGCGMGRLTNCMAGHLPTWQFYGVDISLAMVMRAAADASARGLTNIHYWLCDGRAISPFNNNAPLDLAYSIAVMQHIPHDAMWGYINQVHDRLKPGGKFIFTVAEGEFDTFLNHQIDDVEAFGSELADRWEFVSIQRQGLNDWTWVEATK